MAKKNLRYQYGYLQEWRYCNKMKSEEGWPYVQRCAGSHSKADIIGFDKEMDIYFIQLKSSKVYKTIPKSVYRKELEEFKEWEVPLSVIKRFVTFTRHDGYQIIYED